MKQKKGIRRYQRGREKSEDRQDQRQQNENKHKHTTHNTTLKTKAGVTRTLKNQCSVFSVQCS